VPTKKKDRHPEVQGWTQLPGCTGLSDALLRVIHPVMDRLEKDSDLGVPIQITHRLHGKVGWISCLGIDPYQNTFGLIARVTFDKFGDDISYKIDTEFSGIDTYDVAKYVWERALKHQRSNHPISNRWRTEVAYRLAHPLEDGSTCEIISDAWKMIGKQVKLVSLKDKTVIPHDGKWKDTEIRLGGNMNKTLRRVEENA